MKEFYLPKNYQSTLGLLETQVAIKLVKDTFEHQLANELQLTRVSAPLYVFKDSGLNDDLNGIERPVEFDLLELPNRSVQVVQSLAKWKRLALKQYGIECHKGLYADMNAIRRDEILDNLHSSYVDQWDWEKVISKQDRTLDYLKSTVKKIVQALYHTNQIVHQHYPQLPLLPLKDVYFISTQELEDLYPNLSPKEREHAICKEKKTVFILQIGDQLKSGERHDGRAPDYDDWSLNGDLLVWYPLLNRSIELSSMGIRVDKASLLSQLAKSNAMYKLNYPFHQLLLCNKLPLTMGGGIGQSRICMVLLQKAHIGEVQASIWDDQTHAIAEQHHVHLL